jgi:hypothetical protein
MALCQVISHIRYLRRSQAVSPSKGLDLIISSRNSDTILHWFVRRVESFDRSSAQRERATNHRQPTISQETTRIQIHFTMSGNNTRTGPPASSWMNLVLNTSQEVVTPTSSAHEEEATESRQTHVILDPSPNQSQPLEAAVGCAACYTGKFPGHKTLEEYQTANHLFGTKYGRVYRAEGCGARLVDRSSLDRHLVASGHKDAHERCLASGTITGCRLCSLVEKVPGHTSYEEFRGYHSKGRYFLCESCNRSS